jgi:hypothetical protein
MQSAGNGYFWLALVEWNRKDGSEYLSHIVRVPSDESWASFVRVEINEH